MGYNWEKCDNCGDAFPEEVLLGGLCHGCQHIICMDCGKEILRDYEYDQEYPLCPLCHDSAENDRIEAQEGP